MTVAAALPPVVVVAGVTGALSAAATLLPLPDLAAPKLFGYCFGISETGSDCSGIGAAYYLFPGLIFGLGFAALAARRSALDAPRFAAFVALSGAANAVAVFLCVWLFSALTTLQGTLLKLDGLDLPLALAGAIAGAAGGGILANGAARLIPGRRPLRATVAGGILGLLVPLVTRAPGFGALVFYVLWQAGYGAMLEPRGAARV